MLDVLGYVETRKQRLIAKINELGVEKPSLLIITDKLGNTANQSYIKSKCSFGQQIGIQCDVLEVDKESFGEEISSDLLLKINEYSGTIVQFPFYDYSFKELSDMVTKHIDSTKDVDGLGRYSEHYPCTPLGIFNYISYLIEEKVVDDNPHVVVVGYGGLVGEPLVNMITKLKSGYTVSVIRSKTSEETKRKLLSMADVVVCATPQHNSVEVINPNTVYVDCGCNRVEGKLLGNVSREHYNETALITPVPNGVGRMTVLSLYENVFDAFEMESDDYGQV